MRWWWVAILAAGLAVGCEVLLATDGGLHLVRRRQSLDQILTNELIPEFLQA